ncbi:hypothetical protein HFN20_01250 [Paenibacillus dendritiformis]|uniref:TIGR04104 family putative zinc finger protein n=1 Tax=Paenibacillus dendritiformis TaxID=130049 RepID=UPI00143CE265|nr:hypothetical protein [Paenibacillus dendritiformis]NRG01262.1 hypothetical protein [Paenibacillus dendritiformis]
MQRCLNCGEGFAYKQIMKSLLCAYRSIKCSHCTEIHKIKVSSKLLTAVAVAVSPMISGFFYFEGLYPMDKTIFYFVFGMPVIILLLPFLVRYTRIV